MVEDNWVTGPTELIEVPDTSSVAEYTELCLFNGDRTNFLTNYSSLTDNRVVLEQVD
jgi:hypothetical protein